MIHNIIYYFIYFTNTFYFNQFFKKIQLFYTFLFLKDFSIKISKNIYFQKKYFSGVFLYNSQYNFLINYICFTFIYFIFLFVFHFDINIFNFGGLAYCTSESNLNLSFSPNSESLSSSNSDDDSLSSTDSIIVQMEPLDQAEQLIANQYVINFTRYEGLYNIYVARLNPLYSQLHRQLNNNDELFMHSFYQITDNIFFSTNIRIQRLISLENQITINNINYLESICDDNMSIHLNPAINSQLDLCYNIINNSNESIQDHIGRHGSNLIRSIEDFPTRNVFNYLNLHGEIYLRDSESSSSSMEEITNTSSSSSSNGSTSMVDSP